MRAHSSKRLVLASFALAIGLAGCASSGGGGGGGGGGANVLTAADFTVEMQTLDLDQAIQRLRANWLRGRGGSTPVVYIDGQRRGGLRELSSVRVDEVERVERMNAPDATMRFGTNHDGGAILVTRRR